MYNTLLIYHCSCIVINISYPPPPKYPVDGKVPSLRPEAPHPEISRRGRRRSNTSTVSPASLALMHSLYFPISYFACPRYEVRYPKTRRVYPVPYSGSKRQGFFLLGTMIYSSNPCFRVLLGYNKCELTSDCSTSLRVPVQHPSHTII